LQLYPLKIKIAQKETVVIYFDSFNPRNRWLKTIESILGCKNVTETYKIGKMLG